MTGLGQWLVGILNAHIERHNVVADEPVTAELTIDTTRFDTELRTATDRLIDRPLARYYVALVERDDGGQQPLTQSLADRPCLACGDPGGFHVEHLPCWKVTPFKPTPSEVRAPWA